MKIFYFTATGNSLAIAKAIGGELLSIPQEINKNIETYEDDVIGIIFPTYGFMPPKIIKKFLEKTTFKADYTFSIATYGNTSGKVQNEIQKIVKNNGYQFDYTDCILMVDNYLPLFDINKQIENLPNKKIEENILRIKSNIEKKVKQEKSNYKLYEHILQPIAKSLSNLVKPDNFSQNYIVQETCIKCGTCARVCPVNNIIIDDKVKFKNHCEVCMACIHACPKNAIHLKNEKNNTRWKNPNTSLEEIINANNNYDKKL